MTRIVAIAVLAWGAFQLAANASEVSHFSPVLDFLPGGLPGINLRDFIIGVQGGICAIFLLRKPSPRAIIGSVVAGGFTANYAGNEVALILSWPHDLSVYASGVGGLAMCHGLVELVNYGVTQWTTKKVSK
jgi:hypothetical protein